MKLDNCRAVVVGGAGFLGSHLVNHLINERHCQVTVIDNLVAGRREFIHPKATFVHHDIAQSEVFLLNLFKRFQPLAVFNYAAHPYIPDSFDRPLHVFHANALGAMHVINAAQEAGVPGTLQVSSAEIYGEGPTYENAGIDGSERGLKIGKIDEDAPVSPHSSYGAAKAAIDGYVQARWREAKTRCVALRQFNCVGERETHPYVIPEIISQLDRWDKMEELSSGSWGESTSHVPIVSLGNNSRRDFMYAGDAVAMATELLEVAITRWAAAPEGDGQIFGQVFNLGSQESTQIYDLATRIGGLMGWPAVTVKTDPRRKRPWEIWHLQSDNAKIYGLIERRPRVSFDEALTHTIDDYQKNGWCWE